MQITLRNHAIVHIIILLLPYKGLLQRIQAIFISSFPFW